MALRPTLRALLLAVCVEALVGQAPQRFSVDWRNVDRASDFYPPALARKAEIQAISREQISAYYTQLDAALAEAAAHWDRRRQEFSQELVRYPNDVAMQQRIESAHNLIKEYKARRLSLAENKVVRVRAAASVDRSPSSVIAAVTEGKALILKSAQNVKRQGGSFSAAVDAGNAMIDANRQLDNVQKMYLEGRLPESEWVAALDAYQHTIKVFGGQVGEVAKDHWSWFIDSAGLLVASKIPATAVFRKGITLPKVPEEADVVTCDGISDGHIVVSAQGVAFVRREGAWAYFDGQDWVDVKSQKLADSVDGSALAVQLDGLKKRWDAADGFLADVRSAFTGGASGVSDEHLEGLGAKAHAIASDAEALRGLDSGRLADLGLAIMKVQADLAVRKAAQDHGGIMKHLGNIERLWQVGAGAVPQDLRRNTDLPAFNLIQLELRDIERIIAAADQAGRYVPDHVKNAVRDSLSRQFRQARQDLQERVRIRIEEWKASIVSGLIATAQGPSVYWAVIDEWLVDIERLRSHAVANGQPLSSVQIAEIDGALVRAAAIMSHTTEQAVKSAEEARKLIGALPKSPLPMPSAPSVPIYTPPGAHPAPGIPAPTTLAPVILPASPRSPTPAPPPRPAPMGPFGSVERGFRSTGGLKCSVQGLLALLRDDGDERACVQACWGAARVTASIAFSLV